MRIAIIDADLIGRKRHRFPNLACMKLSGYHKDAGGTVDLKTDYDGLEGYDRVYLSRVFTDTPVPEGIVDHPNVLHGGTGFFYDKATSLPMEIEHHILIFKCQDKTSSGKQYFSHVFIMNEAVNAGFYPLDLFILLAKSRLVADWQARNQRHARKYNSFFWVFRKSEKRIDYTGA